MSTENIRADIEMRQNKKAYPALKFVQKNPGIAAALSKLTTSQVPARHDNAGFRAIDNPDRNNFTQIARSVLQKDKDADTIMQLFPDMELTAQILISSIIAPKDMSTTEISYSLPNGLKVTPIASALVALTDEYFTTDYKIEPLLGKILRECLFGSGSYPMITVPENSVDDVINGPANISLESLKEFTNDTGGFRAIGILGPSTVAAKGSISLESLIKTQGFERGLRKDYDHKVYIPAKNGQVAMEGLHVTDNPDVVKMPALLKRLRERATEYALSDRYRFEGKAALEAYDETTGYGAGKADKHTSRMNDVELTSLFYKNKGKANRNVVKIKTDEELSRRTIGEPLTFRAPSMAIIPVFTPGNESEHVGYFMLLDSEGNPLSKHSVSSNYDGLRGMMQNPNNDMGSALLNRASSIYNTDCKNITNDQAARVYEDIVEADLLARLRNGLTGPNITIGKNEEIYRIMMARTLAKQHTQIVYLPATLVTYFAYKYDDQGVGKSLLEDMAMLNSLRAMLLFSQVMAQVKNSIGRTRVNLKLDELSPNPQKDIEVAMHEVLKARQNIFPLGLQSPSGLADWVQKAGIEFEFEGHPSLPDVSLSFTETQTNYATPDSELEESLRKRASMAAGIPPEMIDNAFSPEFATTALQQNLLLAKRVKQIQEQFQPLLTMHARQRTRNDGIFVEKVKDIIRDNLKKITDVENADELVVQLKDRPELLIELLAMEFLGNYELNLAEPDTVTISNQMEALDAMSDAYDKALAYYINSDMMPEAFAGEEASQRVDEVRAIVKAELMRRWMAKNGILSELRDLSSTDEDGQPTLDLVVGNSTHLNNMTRVITELVKKVRPVADAATRDIQKLSDGDGLGDSTGSAADTSSGDDTSGDDTGGGEDDGMGGMDDLGGDMPDDLPPLESFG